jgi:hypothetical protein
MIIGKVSNCPLLIQPKKDWAGQYPALSRIHQQKRLPISVDEAYTLPVYAAVGAVLGGRVLRKTKDPRNDLWKESLGTSSADAVDEEIVVKVLKAPR